MSTRIVIAPPLPPPMAITIMNAIGKACPGARVVAHPHERDRKLIIEVPDHDDHDEHDLVGDLS